MSSISKITYYVICVLMLSCTNTDSNDETISLKSYLDTTIFETGAVIACAASDNDNGDILTFYYPEEGALNTRYYETKSVEVDPNNFSNYQQVLIESEPIFNGYLRRFSQESTIEKWIVITFELDGEIKVSNPIRSKQISKPTLWDDIVSIEQSQSSMPIFSWQDDVVGDNAIYFQIVSDTQNNLLSGTYTNQNQFQYYKLNNVVLNITIETPPTLQLNTSYHFTLMDVSLDNWVNAVTLNKSFVNR